MYRFWLKAMMPKKRGKASGDSNIHFSPKAFKEKVRKKMKSYHIFIQLGLIAQGMLQYLSIYHSNVVWKTFGTWLRTIRDKTLPSEKVVAMAMSRTYHHFLGDNQNGSVFKFLRDRSNLRSIYDSDYEKRKAA